MYPRNAASPERIAVGAVVQISDGAVQGSGVSISVSGQGGASGAGAGTTAYDNGIVEYTPTQGETDFTSFVVVAYKTGCIPVAMTIITSASSVPGRTMPADGSVTAAVVAADATAELQSGLATGAALAAAQTSIDDLPTNAELATALGTADDAVLTAIAALNNLSQANIRTALGMGAANMDTQLAAIAAYIDTEIGAIISALASLATSVDALPTNAELATALGTLNDITVAEIIAGIADGSYDLQEMLRIIFAACAGLSSEHELGTPKYRDSANTKNRIAATTDADGNRTAIVLDAT